MMNAYTENEDGEKTYTELEDGQQVTMGGMIGAYKKLKTRSGAFMAFVTVEDMFGSIECVCFPKVYERIRSFLETDRVVSLSGKISIEDEKLPAIIIDKMTEFSLDDATLGKGGGQGGQAQATEQTGNQTRETQNANKRLWLNVSGFEDEDIEELLETLSYYGGDTQVCFVRDGKKMLCSQKVTPNKALMAELSTFLPENCIKLV